MNNKPLYKPIKITIYNNIRFLYSMIHHKIHCKSKLYNNYYYILNDVKLSLFNKDNNNNYIHITTKHFNHCNQLIMNKILPRYHHNKFISLPLLDTEFINMFLSENILAKEFKIDLTISFCQFNYITEIPVKNDNPKLEITFSL